MKPVIRILSEDLSVTVPKSARVSLCSTSRNNDIGFKFKFVRGAGDSESEIGKPLAVSLMVTPMPIPQI